MATPQEVEEAIAAVKAEEEPKAEPKEAKPEEPKEPPKEEPKAEPEKPEAKEPEPVKEPAKAEPRPRRKPELIPAVKFHETRHELQAEREKSKRLEEELAAEKAVKSKPAQDRVSEVAAKHGLDPAVVADIVSLVPQGESTDVKAINAKLASIEADKAKVADELRYRSDEDSVLGKFPELKPYAKDLKEMAYTEGNESIPLDLLALKLRHELNLTDSVAPAEGSRTPPSGKPRDLDDLSEDDFAKLSDKELDRLIEKNRMKR